VTISSRLGAELLQADLGYDVSHIGFRRNGQRSSGTDPASALTVGTMDANSGSPWSKMDVSDLRNEIAHGRTVTQIASFLCRDEDEVREKITELG
jgi:hypothetical protein